MGIEWSVYLWEGKSRRRKTIWGGGYGSLGQDDGMQKTCRRFGKTRIFCFIQLEWIRVLFIE